MNTLQEQALALLPIVQALSEGKEVEYRFGYNPSWYPLVDMNDLIHYDEYRIVNADPPPLKLEDPDPNKEKLDRVLEILTFLADNCGDMKGRDGEFLDCQLALAMDIILTLYKP